MHAREIARRGVLRLQIAGRGLLQGSRRHDDQGATLVEYVLMISLIVLVCIVSLTFFGGATSNKLSVQAECFEGLC